MRKWVRIAVALLVIAIAISLPRSETEIHKRNCEAAWESLQGKSFTANLKKHLRRIVSMAPAPSYDNDQLWCSREVLVGLGYLVRQEVGLSDPREVESRFEQKGFERALVWISSRFWSQTVMITAPPSEITAASNLVWKIDQDLERELREFQRTAPVGTPGGGRNPAARRPLPQNGN